MLTVLEGKIPKDRAQYSRAMQPGINSCGVCDHFLLGGACEVVKGEIAARMWCKFFTPEMKLDPDE